MTDLSELLIFSFQNEITVTGFLVNWNSDDEEAEWLAGSVCNVITTLDKIGFNKTGIKMKRLLINQRPYDV